MEHFRNHHERRSLIGQAQWRGSDSERPAAGSPETRSDRTPTSWLIRFQDRQMDGSPQPGAIPQHLHQGTEGLELNSPQRHEGHKEKRPKPAALARTSVPLLLGRGLFIFGNLMMVRNALITHRPT